VTVHASDQVQPRYQNLQRRPGWVGAIVIAAIAAITAALFVPFSQPATPKRPWDCVSANKVTTLTSWSRLADRQIRCAVAFTDANPTWQDWEDPWIIGYRHNWPQYDWVDWYDHGRRGHHLILTQSLIPSGLAASDWLAQGAAGAFEPYARVLARNLIRAGMGNVVIRLGHEANGDWFPDSIPATAAGDAEWVRFWDKTVAAMRSVPGAHFLFDWTVNAGYRPVPLRSFYPGNDYVDVIGIDAYDSLPSAPTATGRRRIRALLNEPDGLRAVGSFARRHNKPMSIPEWGINPAGQNAAIGDDPAYIGAIAGVADSGDVLYQSYFSGGSEGPALRASPRSLAAYRRAFGRNGTAAP
jgi:Glycosyl hydrolase family 26